MAPAPSAAGKSLTSTLLLIILFSCLMMAPFSLAHDNPQFSYPSFRQNDPSLRLSGESSVDQQALQVTRNSGSSDISNSSGQVTYTTPLQLWHRSYNYSASFNTSFLLNMGPILGDATNTTGGGMTFLLSSQPAAPPLNSFGQWLGLYNGSIASDQHQVAIEFDTFKDSFDPDGNHVGIDVNGSIKSAYNVSLSPYNISLTTTASLSGMNTSVWIDYNGHLHTLDVYLANQGSSMSKEQAKHIISGYYIDLRNCQLPDTVYVGFSASVGTILESHCVLEWNFTSTNFPSSSISTGTIIGCSIGGAAIILLVVLLVIILVRRRRAGMAHMMEDLTNLHYGPRKFPYQELKRATKGFCAECKLGQGGFGEVYKGVLMSNGVMTEVAVKCLSQRSKQGEREFKAEVMSMGRMRHKNLVQLLGWSYTGGSRLMLVYEYMPNKSLDKWIGQGQEGVMGWERRYHVVKGLAAGLLYLHEEWEMVVVHRDLKPSNVMLDAEFNARIGDFGLAKLIQFEQGCAETCTIAGTPGYIAPECMDQGIISKESDIYSFGAIAIEIVTGRRLSMDYLHSLLLLLEKSSFHEAADPGLASYDATQLELLLKLGLACCHPHPPARPSIREVVHALSSSCISFSIPTFPSAVSSNVAFLSLLQDSSSSVSPLEAITTGR